MCSKAKGFAGLRAGDGNKRWPEGDTEQEHVVPS